MTGARRNSNGPQLFDMEAFNQVKAAAMRGAATETPAAEGEAEDYATHITAVNQSLAVMSRARASQRQLRTIVDMSIGALSQALHSRGQNRAVGEAVGE